MEKNGQILPHARTNDLVTRDMPDEVLVYDLKSHKAHCLNQTAALVWKHCDGKKSVADIATLIEKDLNTTVDEATVWLAVERLGRAHLLEERVIPPAGSHRLSRREAVRRLGLGAALAVPVVMSIIAPTAQAANTCVGMSCSPLGPNTTQCGCTGCCAGSPGVCVATGGAGGSGCTQPCQCTSGTCNPGGMCTQ